MDCEIRMQIPCTLLKKSFPIHIARRALAFLLIACGFSELLGAADPETSDLRVMSFNIRYGTAKDGDNHWDRRKERVIECISAFNPDLLGTQETLGFQRDYLAKNLPDYEGLGVGRDDGADKGEMMALYFRKDRFEKRESGHFWLSETPDKIGSKSWDSSLPRMVTWVKLHRTDDASGLPIVFFNTHFDHLGETARLESARLLRRQLETLGKGSRLIVTGDFNTGEDSHPYKALFGDDSPVVDSYRTSHPNREGNEGTFSGFDAKRASGLRIDWIAVSRDWRIVEANIDRTAHEGRTPSDHYPVTAVLSTSDGQDR
jgi:endonuclease/exonuclease/phosphatase family metal-dependent hydrolase